MAAKKKESLLGPGKTLKSISFRLGRQEYDLLAAAALARKMSVDELAAEILGDMIKSRLSGDLSA